MSFFKNLTHKGRPVLRSTNSEGTGDLLVLLPPPKTAGAPVPEYARSLLDRVFTLVQPMIGPWHSVTVVACDDRVGKVVKEFDATHVLLVGRQFSKIVTDVAKLPAESNTYGILVEHREVRWVNTMHLAVYGVGSQTSWKQASLLGHLYRHLELLRIGLPGWDDPAEPVKHRLVENEDDWRKLKKRLQTKRLVAIDTETTSLRRIGNTILTIQFGFDGVTGWVLPVAHPESPLSPKLLREILEFLRDYFERADRAVHVYINAPFDIHQLIDLLKLRWYNHDVYDCQTGSFCFDPQTIVCTEAGDVTIADLVAQDKPPRVWSFNHDSQKLELAEIVGKSRHATKRRMVEIEYEGGSLRVTEDHKIWSVTRNAYVEAASLLDDEEVLILDELPYESC